MVECPQDAQAAVYGVAALHAHETGYPPLPEGLPDACEESQPGRLGVSGASAEGTPEQHQLPRWGLGRGAGGGLDQDPPVLLVTHTKVSGYIWHMRWTTSICSSVLFTASLFWVSQGVYADQN